MMVNHRRYEKLKKSQNNLVLGVGLGDDVEKPNKNLVALEDDLLIAGDEKSTKKTG